MQGLHLENILENILIADGMQRERVLVFGRKQAHLPVLDVVAGTALYQFKSQNW